MKKYLLVLLIVVFLTSGCNSATAAFINGLNTGLSRNYYYSPPPKLKLKQVDLFCANDCMAKGYLMSYCHSLCSY